mmetsp:Transcript_12481/g.19709  ORF Transcript_12481/g.19709 Transcript_12481/m.19709 type:complete len:231 (+) Transcript_12481:1809-2501(+)
MRDTLNGIHNRARQIVGRIRLVLSSTTMVGRQVLTEQDGITKGSIVAGHVNLGTQAPRRAVGAAGTHEFELLLGLGGGHGPVLGLDTIGTFQLHLLLWRVIHVRQSLLDHRNRISVNGGEVVGCIRNDVGLDTKKRQIFHDRLLILFLLLARVCIVESDNQTPLVPARAIVIQQNGLGVSHVQVATRLGREPSDHASGCGTLEQVHTRHQRIQIGRVEETCLFGSTDANG